MSGPSGAGKGTLIRGIRKYFPDLEVAVSATTRSPRPGEVDGREYHFLDATTFEQRVTDGEFLEHVDFAGNRYGTLKSEIERAHSDGHSIVLELELEGALTVRDSHAGAALIFIEPPDFDELERRLRSRAADTDDEIRDRMAVARRQFEARKTFDHIIVNDEQDRAVAALQQVISDVLNPHPAQSATRPD